MRRAPILLAAVLAVSCGGAPPTATNRTEAAKPPGAAGQSPVTAVTPPAPSIQYPLPDVQNFTQADVWRSSGNKGSDGFDLPPWKEVNMDVRFDVKPAVGEKVTIVPLDVDIAPADLKILKVTLENKSCDEKKPEPLWLLGLEPVAGGPFFEAKAVAGRREDAPFDVCAIHPAVKFARQLRREQLTKEMLPEGISPNTVTAAIDLTNDGQPDLLIAYYCCNDATKPREECDLTCGKAFKRTGGGWKLVDESTPC